MEDLRRGDWGWTPLCVRYAPFRSKKACFGVLEAHFAAEVIIVSLTRAP